MAVTYRVVRVYRNPALRSCVVKSGLMLNEARAFCQHHDARGSTARNGALQWHYNKTGEWLSYYEPETTDRRVRIPFKPKR